MIYIAGVIIIIVGIVQLVRYFIKSTRTQIETTIAEITLAYHEKDKQQIKKHPHALVRYNHRGNLYEKKVLLMKKGLNEGDKIQLAINENKPENAEMISPKQEIITGIALIAIGIIIVLGCHFLINNINW